jgi:hypothetical protein
MFIEIYMNYKHLVTFILVFMIIEYLLLVTEWPYYLNMISDIQGYKFNFFKNEKNEFTFKNLFIFSFLYVALCVYIYYYMIQEHKSIAEGILFVSVFWMIFDFCFVVCFDKYIHHIPVLLYDTFIVGGACMGLTQYILYNYYDTLKHYIPLLSLGYLCTMFYFFYTSYKYNPTVLF